MNTASLHPDTMRATCVPRSRFGFGLTEREHQVLELLLDGQSNAEISAALVIRAATVSDHVQSVMRKVDVQSRSRLFKQVILK